MATYTYDQYQQDLLNEDLQRASSTTKSPTGMYIGGATGRRNPAVPTQAGYLERLKSLGVSQDGNTSVASPVAAIPQLDRIAMPTLVPQVQGPDNVDAITPNADIQALLSGFKEQLTSASNPFTTALTNIQSLLGGYSKGAAFSDASAIVNREATKQARKNAPVLQRAAEGAGTSAGSMQGLMANQFAVDTAEAAGALGAQQAVQYGNISANLSSALASLAANGDPIAKSIIQLQQLQTQDIGNQRSTNADLFKTKSQTATSTNATNAQLYAAQLQALVSRQNAGLDYASRIYGADKSLEGTKYGADAGITQQNISSATSTANAQLTADASNYKANKEFDAATFGKTPSIQFSDPSKVLKAYEPTSRYS